MPGRWYASYEHLFKEGSLSCERPACSSEFGPLRGVKDEKGVRKDLMAMKVGELKEELEERGEAKSGNKA